MGLIRFCFSYKKTVVYILSFLVCVILTGLRSFVDPRISLLIFHFIPVIFATWCISMGAGVFFSFLSIAAWLTGDYFRFGSLYQGLVQMINEAFTLAGFFFMVFILSKLRGVLERERELASRDSLTGIYNRRAFYDIAGSEIIRAERFTHPLSVAYIDLDNFKTVNDLMGHAAGDDLLCSVTDTISSNVRSIDIIARLGGDEFVVLFPETGSATAVAASEKIEKKLNDDMFQNNWPVTFSIGLVTFERPPDSVNELIQRSDALMYSAKQSGKNMIKTEIVMA